LVCKSWSRFTDLSQTCMTVCKSVPLQTIYRLSKTDLKQTWNRVCVLPGWSSNDLINSQSSFVHQYSFVHSWKIFFHGIFLPWCKKISVWFSASVYSPQSAVKFSEFIFVLYYTICVINFM
jgi:hypothetical protein